MIINTIWLVAVNCVFCLSFNHFPRDQPPDMDHESRALARGYERYMIIWKSMEMTEFRLLNSQHQCLLDFNLWVWDGLGLLEDLRNR